MKNNLIFSGLLIITFNSCMDATEKKHTNNNNNTIEYTKPDTKKKSPVNQEKKSEKADDTLYSFVLSCGSGCAFTYNLKSSHLVDNEEISVNFSITMWIDEKVSDEYSESYIIKFREEEVQSIYSVDNKNYLTEEESPDLFREIKKTGKILQER